MKNIIITDYNPTIVKELKALDYNVFTHSANPIFKTFLGHHTDLFLCRDDETLFVGKGFGESLIKGILHNLNVCKCDEISEGYPCEASLNCVFLGDKLLCNKKTVDLNVLKYAQDRALEIVHTNQGYTKCSVAVVGTNAVITEDEGIQKALTLKGVKVLKVQKGSVSLNGFDYGFIGGASFYDKNKKTVYFFGNIGMTPYCDDVVAFCEEQGSKLVCLAKNQPLTDLGSALIL